MLRDVAARSPFVVGVLLLAACGSTYYDPLPPSEARYEAVGEARAHTLEQTYRLLYERLEGCYGSGYHVQPRFERARGEAWIMLVTGLGLNRYSLVGNRFEARVDMRERPGEVEVVVIHRDPSLAGLGAQVERWLAGGSACSG